MKKNTLHLILSTLFIGVLIMSSCKKEKKGSATDQELYNMSKLTADFTWFYNSSALLNRSSGSGHAQPFLRTRYNAIAADKLDSTGRIKPGSTFPEGSLIVKELYEDSTTLGRYAILYKKASSIDADANGWVWGYVNTDGSVAEPASNKGSACRNCHSQTDNIDYMLMNKYFP